MAETEFDELNDLLALDMEYRLTIAFRLADGGCECPAYLIRRREALMPAVLTEARERGEDPADVFAAFARRFHALHEAAPVPHPAAADPSDGGGGRG